jgi:hypothetical protein
VLGTEIYGCVDRLGNERVETEFWQLLLPLWPRASYYAVGEGADAHLLPLALHAPSIALGLARPWLWMAAVIVGSATLFDPDWRNLWPLASGLVALAAVVTWGLGRLSTDEAARRAILQRTVGHGAPPELLPAAAVEQVRAALDAAWTRAHALPWRAAIAQGVASDWLVALAEYHRDARRAEAARANLDRTDLFN